MRRTLQAAAVYLVLLIIVTLFLLFFNGSAGVLPSGDALPEGINTGEYALCISETGSEADWHFSGAENVQGDLMLTVADLGSFRLWLNGQLIWETPEDSTYVRTTQVPIVQALLADRADITLRIEPISLFSSVNDVLARARVLSAKVLLGEREVSQRHQNAAFALSMVLLGLCLLSFLLCLLLYIGKPSEKYLLTISMVSLICAFTSLFMSNNPLLPIKARTYALLLPFIAICPVVISPAICFFLCEDSLPGWSRRFLSIPVLLLFTALLLFLRLALHYSFYTLARFIMMIPVMLVLAKAFTDRMWGAGLLMAGYALADGQVFAVFFINILRISTPSAVLVYLNVNYLSYLSVMLTALIVVTHRFSSKFRETEQLSSNLAELNRTLDARVAERTMQLEQEQEKRRNMMVNVIHDLRSPLFILKGYLAQLSIAPDELPMQEVMERKLTDVERLVEDLFLTAKLEDDACFYAEDRIMLRDLVLQLMQDNAPEAERRNVALNGEITDYPCWVWADALRLRQAIQNLVDNAFTYTPAGGWITVSLAAFEQEAEFRIINTGSVIAPQDLPYVFERYYHPGHADHPKSSGLGLSIAREITEHHRGTIRVTSDSAGTAFILRFPLL